MYLPLNKAAFGTALALVLSACVSAPPKNLGNETLRQDSIERQVSEFTLRLRNINCTEAQTGSGFAIDNQTLVTNRHVVDGAETLQVNTWKGDTLEVGIAEVSGDEDIAIVRTEEPLPEVAELAKEDPSVGEKVTVVGYPEGGALTFVDGTVLDYRDDSRLGGYVLRTEAEVKLGNSGGPLIDEKGKVVGVVFAIEVATDNGLALPVSTLRSVLDNNDDREPIVSTCEGVTSSSP